MLKVLGAKTTKSIGIEFDGTYALPPAEAPLAIGAVAE